MKSLAILVFAISTSGLSSGAEDKKVDTKLLAGKWVVFRSESDFWPQQSFVEFAKSGAVTMKPKMDAKETTMLATYKIEGSTVVITDKKKATTKFKIKSIDGGELVLEDEKGNQQTFLRFKEVVKDK